jgi:ketosteroid isomerase-like protein
MPKHLLVVFFLLTAASAAIAQPAEDPEPFPSTALPPEFERVLRDYEQAWQAGDAAGLAALFTPDAFVLRPGHPPVRGRDAIEEAYRGAGGALSLRALDLAHEGPVGYIVGAYGYGAGGDRGKFILALRRDEAGRWLIAADMDNQNPQP